MKNKLEIKTTSTKDYKKYLRRRLREEKSPRKIKALNEVLDIWK